MRNAAGNRFGRRWISSSTMSPVRARSASIGSSSRDIGGIFQIEAQAYPTVGADDLGGQGRLGDMPRAEYRDDWKALEEPRDSIEKSGSVNHGRKPTMNIRLLSPNIHGGSGQTATQTTMPTEVFVLCDDNESVL